MMVTLEVHWAVDLLEKERKDVKKSNAIKAFLTGSLGQGSPWNGWMFVIFLIKFKIKR